jgi:hypothetical protein
MWPEPYILAMPLQMQFKIHLQDGKTIILVHILSFISSL